MHVYIHTNVYIYREVYGCIIERGVHVYVCVYTYRERFFPQKGASKLKYKRHKWNVNLRHTLKGKV